jgi:hypothetical protein
VGDTSGDVYQFNIPAKSLFGKGTGNVHPFESYVKYLGANNEDVDGVVTNISYDLNADSMEFLFTPMRNISDEEYALVQHARLQPETKQYTMLTVAQADGVTAKPTPKPEAPAPVKRATKKVEEAPVAKPDLSTVIDDWGDDD